MIRKCVFGLTLAAIFMVTLPVAVVGWFYREVLKPAPRALSYLSRRWL